MATLTSEYQYLARSSAIKSKGGTLYYYLLLYGKTVPNDITGIHRVSILGRIASINTGATFYHYTTSHSGTIAGTTAFSGTNKPSTEWSYINSSGASIGGIVYKTYTDIGEGSVDVDCTNGLAKDVTLTFNWSMKSDHNDSYAAQKGDFSVSATATLSAIPRASSLSSVGDFTIGDVKTLSINRNSDNFTHTIGCIVSGEEKTIATNVGDRYSWDTGASDLFLWKKAASSTDYISGTLRLYTYSGTTLLGYKDTPFKANVPTEYKGESIAPLLSCNISPDNSNIGGSIADSLSGKYIANKSKIRANFSGSNWNHSIGFGKVFVSVDGNTYTSTDLELVTAPIQTSGDNVKVVVSVEDASGRKTSREETISVMPYSLPTVSNYSCKRVQYNEDDEQYEVNQTGTSVRVSGTRSFVSLDGTNTCEVYFEVYESGGTSPIRADLCVSSDTTDNVFSFVISDIVFDMEKSYVIYLYAKDKLGTGTKFPTTVPISIPSWHAASGGKGFSVGMITPLDANGVRSGFHVGFDATFYGGVGGTVYGLGMLPELPSGTNADTWLKFGAWSVRTNAIAATITGLPSGEAGTLRVWSSVGDGSNSGSYYYIIQEYTTYTNSAIYRRYIAPDGVRAWKTIVMQ